MEDESERGGGESSMRAMAELLSSALRVLESSATKLSAQSRGINVTDELLDWVINVNDELLERFGASMDEFKEGPTKEEETCKGREGVMDDYGFQIQLVCGKMIKKEESVPGSGYSATGISVATKDRRISEAKANMPFSSPWSSIKTSSSGILELEGSTNMRKMKNNVMRNARNKMPESGRVNHLVHAFESLHLIKKKKEDLIPKACQYLG